MEEELKRVTSASKKYFIDQVVVEPLQVMAGHADFTGIWL